MVAIGTRSRLRVGDDGRVRVRTMSEAELVSKQHDMELPAAIRNKWGETLSFGDSTGLLEVSETIQRRSGAGGEDILSYFSLDRNPAIGLLRGVVPGTCWITRAENASSGCRRL